MMETERLILRPWRESDAEALFKYASDPDVGPRVGWPQHQSVEDSLEVIRKIFSNDHTWALELKETGEAIGCIGYYPYGESNIKIGENDEILLKGPTITKGYYKRDALNKESFTEDGFFRTGDAGYLKDGELFLKERIKELYKTSNGKYIAPQMIESKLLVD